MWGSGTIYIRHEQLVIPYVLHCTTCFAKKVRTCTTHFFPSASVSAGELHCRTLAMSVVPLSRKSDTLSNPEFLTKGVRIPVASFPSLRQISNNGIQTVHESKYNFG